MFLMGNFQHSLDDKNRIRLPADFRSEMGNAYYLMPGTNGCIFVYCAGEAKGIMAKLFSSDSFDPEKNLKIAQITAFSRSVTADSQGRFMLPDDLIRIMGIKKDVRIVGAGQKAIIWSEERWQQMFGNIDVITPENFDSVYKFLDENLAKEQ